MVHTADDDVLTPSEVDELMPFGHEREISGEVLFGPGDSSYDFFVIPSGEVEVTGSSAVRSEHDYLEALGHTS